MKTLGLDHTCGEDPFKGTLCASLDRESLVP